jgi:hypothetical protein
MGGLQIREAGFDICKQYFEQYWPAMWKELDRLPELKNTLPAFLHNPEKLVLYLGKNHLAIEFTGPLETEEIQSTVHSTAQIFDYSKADNLMDKILGFEHDNTSDLRIPLSGLVENLYAPSLEAHEILERNGWTFGVHSMALSMNAAGYDLLTDAYTRLVNCFFFGAKEGGIINRHIKWLDVFPARWSDIDEETESFKVLFWSEGIDNRARKDAHYIFPKPTDFQGRRLHILNNFIQLFSSSGIDETEITRFLADADNQFILKMAFFAKNIHAEKTCPWAEDTKKPIKPDFLVESPNGFADIVEFKLPTIKSASIVGQDNRETFSAEIHSYVAQTRVYSEYFQDPRNRRYVEEKYGLKVMYPKRWLVIGRRWMFSTDEWKAIEHEFNDFSIKTYDDIVDGVRIQLYS